MFDQDEAMRCQAIAKFQQAVEKVVKAIVAALKQAAVLHVEIGYRHEVERFLSVLLRLPRAKENKSVDQHLRRVLDEQTRSSIHALDNLVPRKPPPGHAPQRNTEYPFHNPKGFWTYPAATGVFSAQEVERYRALSHRIVQGAGRIISVIRRKPS